MREQDIEDIIRKRGIDVLPPWEGIDRILDYYKQAEKTPFPQDSKDTLTLLFEGGFRRSEAIKIRRNMCFYNEEAIVIRKAPVLNYRLRKHVVEPVFGHIKHARGFRQLLLRGIEKVSNEWAMLCTAHNIAKLAAWA